tara:strand:- start:123 stop:428 length:306 start_codon:yes stop_codon:yes gene_type:complete
MNDDELNRLADLIVDKLLTKYIEEQTQWYSNSTFTNLSDLYSSKKRKTNKKADKPLTEDELLGELAKLLTQIDYHKTDENYEKCAELQKKVDEINKKLKEL